MAGKRLLRPPSTTAGTSAAPTGSGQKERDAQTATAEPEHPQGRRSTGRQPGVDTGSAPNKLLPQATEYAKRPKTRCGATGQGS